MPKPLREPPPTSSVARLFDMEAAARAVANTAPSPLSSPAEALRPPTDPPPSAHEGACRSGEQPHVKRELVLTPRADTAMTRLVDLYRRATGTRLTTSHVARAVLCGVEHSMASLEREARKLGPMRLPSNARGRELERERFESRLADAFISGIRAAAAFDPDE